MPLTAITVNSKTFNPSQTGRYLLSTLTWGQPLNYFKLTPGTTSNNGITTMSTSRIIQKDVVVGDKTERRQLSVQLIVQTTGDFTTAEINGAVSDIDAYTDEPSLNYQLNGGQ